jgi:hypothetical protein
MEWELQQAGFDYTYDKRLYDRLHAGNGRAAREHLLATPDFQDHSLRFMENHDEPRAAAAFSPAMHRAAALITFTTPGLRLVHEGQLQGRKVFTSMHLARRPVEQPDAQISSFYNQLLACLRRPEPHEGAWRLHGCRPAWDGNPTWEPFYVATWESPGGLLLAVVNYGGSQGQCYVTLPLPALSGRQVSLVDLLSETRYERDGSGLAGPGLYLDMPAWGHHLFELRLH